MLVRLIFILFSFLLNDNAQAAGVGPQCFNYEIYDHENPAGPPNQSIVNYDYLTMTGRHGIIPMLAAVAYRLGISLMNNGAPVIPWQHGVILLGGPLNAREACQMAIDRQTLGINVNFRHPAAIAAIAAGAPLPVAAGLAGMGLPNFLAYLNQALRGGGYLSPQAAAIYRLRHNIPQPNFVWLALPGGVGSANCVIIHFRDTMRVSKNLKELSYNSLIAPGIGGPYVSIKDMIDAQFAAFGLPAPFSATVVSADFLQNN